MSNLKKALFVVAFVIITLTVPALILLLTVDASVNFGAYVIVYGVILFSIFGYMIISMHSLSKEIREAVEEMKMQNAAIAYKLTNNPVQERPVEVVKEEPQATTNVKLNPAEPLKVDGKVVSSETIGDFE